MASMVLSSIPALTAEVPEGGTVGRSVTDDANDLIIPDGDVYELSGCHTYKRSVQIMGILKVKPWDDKGETSGMLLLRAPNITIGGNGGVYGNGRGYGGGGGGLNYYSSGTGGYGGIDGFGGNGGNGYSYYYGGGGGGGSNGGRGGIGYSTPNGGDGTEAGGGTGASASSYAGGRGGTGFGSGGGGGGAYYGGGGGGGGGGTGGKDASWYNGGDGAGPYGGKGPNGVSWTTPGQNEYGRNGGYREAKANGDGSTNITVWRGSGGSGGASVDYYYAGGGGGGGAGGAAITLYADYDLRLSGIVTAAGGAGGQGGMNYYGGPGGRGGGGAGGGIALFALKLIISGTVDASGRDGEQPSEVNGGTVKLLYGETLQNNGNVLSGRTYSNARPKMKGLDTPLNNDQVVRKPTFKWFKATDIEGDPITYEIELASNPGFNPVSRRKTDIVNTSYSFESPLSGTLYWRVRGVDHIGGGGWSETRKMIVDDKPPTSRIDPLPDYVTSQTFLVSWNGKDVDPGSGIAGYNILVSDNGGPIYTWLKAYEGTSAHFEGEEGHAYRFVSQAVDAAENVESIQPDSWVATTVDSVAPLGSITVMPQWQSKGKFTVSWSARDTTSGIADYTVYVSVNGGDFAVWLDNTTEVSAQYPGTEGNKYTFFVLARDVAGNIQDPPGPEKMITTRIDGTMPATTFISEPAPYGQAPTYIRQTAFISLVGTDNFAGVNATYYIIDTRSRVQYVKPFREMQVGSHNITYWSVDEAGNEEARKVTWFWVDSETPTTTLLLVGPNWTTETRVYISAQTLVGFTAVDKASGVNRTVYNVDEGGDVVYSGPFKLPKSGLHNIRFYSVDNVGLQDPDKNASVILDIWNPSSVALVESRVSSKDIVVELRGSDLESGLAGVYYRVVKKGEPGMNFVKGTLVTIQAAADHSLDGPYTLEYYAVDNVGNREEVRKLELTIDTVGTVQVDITGSPTVEDPVFHVSGRVEPGSNVTVNGLNVIVRKDGSYDYTLELKDGRNKIVVTATDPAGNEATVTKYVTYSKPQAMGSFLVPIAAVIIIIVVVAVLAAVFMRKRPRPAASPPGAAPPQPAPPVPPAAPPPRPAPPPVQPPQ